MHGGNPLRGNKGAPTLEHWREDKPDFNKSDAAPQQLLTELRLGLFLGRNFPKELSYIPLQCQRLGEGPSRDARTQKNKDELT
ncbi:hypothetical protein CRPA24_55040 [Pseudomonas aeruginosa]